MFEVRCFSSSCWETSSFRHFIPQKHQLRTRSFSSPQCFPLKLHGKPQKHRTRAQNLLGIQLSYTNRFAYFLQANMCFHSLFKKIFKKKHLKKSTKKEHFLWTGLRDSQNRAKNLIPKSLFRNEITAGSAGVQNRGCLCLSWSQIQFNFPEEIKAWCQTCPPSLYFTSPHLASLRFPPLFSCHPLIHSPPPPQPYRRVSVTPFSADGSLSAGRQPANCAIMWKCIYVCVVRVCEALEGQSSDGIPAVKCWAGRLAGQFSLHSSLVFHPPPAALDRL